jgi:hypothetical protein
MATFKILASMKQGYQFTGADRNGSYTYSATSSYLEFKAVDRGGTEVCFSPNQNVSILSARLLSGVPGVVCGDNGLAADLTLLFGTQDNCAVDDTLAEVPLSIVEWNYSEKQVKSISGAILTATTPIFAFIKNASSYNVMDFNVQDDWVGQEFIPELELIIETDHLLTMDGEVLH